MLIPEDRLYSEFHLWVMTEGSRATIGISDHAAEELGEAAYVQLPQPGESIVRDSSFGMVETSKALTDLLAPISGTVVEANLAVQEAPEMLTRDPYGTGWLITVEPSEPGELDLLMASQRYRDLVGG